MPPSQVEAKKTLKQNSSVLLPISRTSKKLFKSKEVEQLLSESYPASAFIPGTRFEGTHPAFTTAGADESFGYYPIIQQRIQKIQEN